MSIVYSGGTIVNSTFTTGSVQAPTDLLNGLIAAFVAAGWTRSENPAFGTAAFSGQPTAGDTITLDSSPNQKVYTFRASVATTANEILIDSTLALTIDNLKQAVIGGPGSGSKYGSATTAHATFGVKSTTTTQITFQYLTVPAASGNGAPMTKSATVITLSAASLSGGATNFLSFVTPQGLQCNIGLYTTAGGFYNPGTSLNWIVSDRTLTRQSFNLCGGSGGAVPPNNTQYRVIINKYQACLFTVGARSVVVPGSFIFSGVPYVPTFQAAQQIATAAGTPILCNAVAHGLSTGNQCQIVGGVGNTAMNGIQTVTVVDANNFTLNGTTSNGTYTPNSAYMANTTLNDRVSECIFGCGPSGGGASYWGTSITAANDWTCVNGNSRGPDNSTAQSQFVIPVCSIFGATTQNVQFFNNNFVLSEPLVAFGVSNGATPHVMGQIWDSVLVRQNLTLEQAATFDTHNFLAVGVDASHLTSLLLATA